MSQISFPVFRPRDGAVLDLGSLSALAEAPHDLLAAMLEMWWPGAQGLVLSGLELVGTTAPAGPPGSVRPDAEQDSAVVTPGAALIRGRDNRIHLLRIAAPLRCPWPDATGPRVRGVLVAYAEAVDGASEHGLSVARDEVHVQIGFVKPKVAEQPHLLHLASAVGNGRDWATDISRVLQPEHAVIQGLLKRFDSLEQTVWKAEPEGSVWDRQILGRSWVRYQTVAASALQSARFVLTTTRTSTLERVRVLTNLRKQLEQSVERAATELLQVVGPAEGAGPYEAVIGARR